ncbi:MAG TPA: hypothetical protein VIH45_06610, partial [Desulfuromonadaceae bacterium]
RGAAQSAIWNISKTAVVRSAAGLSDGVYLSSLCMHSPDSLFVWFLFCTQLLGFFIRMFMPI